MVIVLVRQVAKSVSCLTSWGQQQQAKHNVKQWTSNSLSGCNLDIIVRCLQCTSMYDLCGNKWHLWWHNIHMLPPTPPHPHPQPFIRTQTNDKWLTPAAFGILPPGWRVCVPETGVLFVPFVWSFPWCRFLFVHLLCKWPKYQITKRQGSSGFKLSSR